MDTKTVTVPSEIAQNLKAAEEDFSARYDESARNLVAEKPVLAYILKSALDEYAGYTVQEIAARFIEGNPELRTMAVNPDNPDSPDYLTNPDSLDHSDGPRKWKDTSGSIPDNLNHSDSLYKWKDTSGSASNSNAGADSGCSEMMSGDDKVEGLSTVDKSQRDGTIYYDIRFLAVIPQSGELVEIYVNIEIQNDDTPGYPIPKRGIYYAARMISSQRGTIFKDQEYGKIKRVVSIWVCEDTAKARSDTINRYSFAEECLRGNFHEEKGNYDLMTVVVLRLGVRGEKSGDNAIRLLSKLFSMDLKYEEKITALSDEFKIKVTREISEEVLKVCNLSTGVFSKGYDMGITAGEMKKARETAYELQDMGLPIDKIANAVKVGIDTVQKWIAERSSVLTK